MNYLTVENLTKSYTEKVLFENITFYIDKGQKVAFIAQNGTGKTTLLRIIAGLEFPESGTTKIHKDITLGYLGQDPKFKSGETILQAIYDSGKPVMQAIKEYEECMLHPEDGDRMQKAFELMDSTGAWDFEQRAKEILSLLQVGPLDRKVDVLSGGQQKRLALAKVLIDEPDFLILDEPTNHLDLDMIEWLEEYLTRANMTILMVTHDRYFLEHVCNEIMELDRGVIYRSKGNYSWYLEKKAERENSEAAGIGKAQNLMRKELEWMRRQPKARGTKSKSRIDAFYDLRDKANSGVDKDELNLHIKMNRMGGKILEMHHLSKSFGDLKVLEDFSYKFKEGERVGIVGRNGVGKTTFLDMIMNNEQPDSGKVVAGQTIVFGYYSQAGMKFDEGKRVIEIVKDIAEHIPVEKGKTISASQFLERFLFPPEQQYTPVSKLSGGEKRRLYLMTVLMKNPNFLILDEPTNDLDILTLNVLEDFLESYRGCLMMVSHDRHFMDKLVDHLFIFEGGGKVKDFNGNYSHYRAVQDYELEQLRESKRNIAAAKPAAVVQAAPIEKKKLSYKEKQEYEQLEQEIADLEQKKADLTDKLSSGKLSNNDIQNVSSDLTVVIRNIEMKTERWLYLAEFV
ncbi:ABC-F family ATP-binding cassette domain-containing protein [soil metagenome]